MPPPRRAAQEEDDDDILVEDEEEAAPAPDDDDEPEDYDSADEYDDGAAGLKLTTSQAVEFGDVWENQRKRLGVFGSKDYRCVAIGSPCLGGCTHCDPI